MVHPRTLNTIYAGAIFRGSGEPIGHGLHVNRLRVGSVGVRVWECVWQDREKGKSGRYKLCLMERRENISRDNKNNGALLHIFHTSHSYARQEPLLENICIVTTWKADKIQIKTMG